MSDAAARERALSVLRKLEGAPTVALFSPEDVRALADALAAEQERTRQQAEESADTINALSMELQDSEERARQLVGLVQRWQPAGSPPPGGTEVLIRWIMQSLSNRAEDAEERTRQLEEALREERELRELIEDDHWPWEWQVATAERERRKRAEKALREIRALDHDDFDTAFRYEQAVRFIAHGALDRADG